MDIVSSRRGTRSKGESSGSSIDSHSGRIWHVFRHWAACPRVRTASTIRPSRRCMMPSFVRAVTRRDDMVFDAAFYEATREFYYFVLKKSSSAGFCFSSPRWLFPMTRLRLLLMIVALSGHLKWRTRVVGIVNSYKVNQDHFIQCLKTGGEMLH